MTHSTPAPTPAPTPATADAIRQALQDALHPDWLEVVDESAQHAGHAGANALGYGSHMRVRIAAAAFQGQSRVAAHRMVYAVLQPFMDAGLHALAIDIVATPPQP